MMSIFDRIMLFFSAIVLALTSVIAFFISRSAVYSTFYSRVHNLIWGNYASALFLGLIVLVILFYILSLVFRRESLHSSSNRSIVKVTSMGDVRVSLSAVEDLVARIAKGNKNVRDAKATVYGDADNMTVTLKLEITAGVNIPELCSDMEANLIQVVDQMMGLVPKQIHFDISNVSGDIPKFTETKNTEEKKTEIVD